MTLAELGPYAGVVVAALVSGVAPLVVVEIYLVAIVADGANPAIVVALAALATVISKLPVYLLVRRVGALPRVQQWLARWTARLRGSAAIDLEARGATPISARWSLVLVAASSLVGLPPFSLVAALGALGGMSVRAFTALVLAGRTLRFAIVIAFTTWAGGASA